MLSRILILSNTKTLEPVTSNVFYLFKILLINVYSKKKITILSMNNEKDKVSNKNKVKKRASLNKSNSK